MRNLKKAKALGLAVLAGLGLMTTRANATATAVLTITATTDPGGTTGTWSVFEQNVYTNAGANTTSNGLTGIEIEINNSGNVAITSATNDLPSGQDATTKQGGGGGGANGFVVNNSNGVISGGGALSLLHAAQSTNYNVNTTGDVFNVYTGVGNIAETIKQDHKTGSSTDVTLPVLVADGTWAQTDASKLNGDLAVTSTTTLISLLPVPMPSSKGGNIATFSPDLVNTGSVHLGVVPEPATMGLLAVGGLLTLARRRTSKPA